MNRILLLIFFFIPVIASAQDSLNVRLLYHWRDPSIPGSSFYNNAFNETWTFTNKGREYAVIGSTLGTHIIDVTNTTAASEVAFIPGASQGTHIIHRDFKSYKNYLYMVCDEGASTLQIADVSFLPDSAPLVYNSSVLFSRAHNIFIDTATAKLYTGFGVYSLANPENPAKLVLFSEISWWPTSIGYLHDSYSRNDTLYCNAQNIGLFVVDFTNISNPHIIGSLTTYPDKGYNHSGWMNEKGNIYAFADETHGMDIKICDVSDPANIQVLSTVNSNVDSNSIPHNIIIRKNYMYVSYYYDGLYVWNISNPSSPKLAGYYDTCLLPNKRSYEGAWGVNPNLPSGKITISDMQEGLFVFALDTATDIPLIHDLKVTIFPNPFQSTVNIEGNLSYHFEIYDITGKYISRGVANKNTTLELNSLQNGIYILKLLGADGVSALRLVKADHEK